MNWRRLFPIIFLFTCVDGFISNWLYSAILPLLIKDIFILIVYILFFITREQGKNWVFEFKRSIGDGSWYLAISLMLLGALQIFNPGVPVIQVGVFGFKVMFFYWPLAILAYAYVDNVDSVQRFMKTIVYFSIPICIFGIYQFWQAPDFMPRVFGEGFKKAIVITGGPGTGGGFLRVFGTFASSGQFTQFLNINIMFIFGLLFSTTKKFERVMMIGCLVLNYISILCTGSRGGLLLLFPTAFLFVILCRWLWRAFFVAFLLAVSLNFGFHYLGQAVIQRFETAKDVAMIRDRTIGATSGMFKIYLEKYPFGKGMGTASVGSRHLFSKTQTSTDIPAEIQMIENYPTKLLCEVGIIGVILFYLLLLSLAIHWIIHWVKLVDRKTYIVIAALTSYCWATFILATFGTIDSPPIAIFLWAEVGIVAKLATFQSNDQYPLST